MVVNRAWVLGWLRLESSGVAAEARLLSGYCRDSRHGGSGSWATQGTKAAELDSGHEGEGGRM